MREKGGTWMVGKKGKKKRRRRGEQEQRERGEKNLEIRYFGSCEKKKKK